MSVLSAGSYRWAIRPSCQSTRKRGQVSSASPTKTTSARLSKLLFADARPRTADNCEGAAPPELGQDFAHARALNHHPGYADNIGFGAPLEIDWLDVLVDD